VGKRVIKMIASDAGGTMTDVLFVDEHGKFTLGKASTTRDDEFIGLWDSLGDAAESWGMDWEKVSREVLSTAETIIYSGTAMLNVLLTRVGLKVGVIVNKGQEDSFLQGRGKQSWAGYAYDDRLHTTAHIHPAPLVPRRLMKGVTERISMFGEVVIPLYEHEVREAVKELLDEDVTSIVICFLYSYLNRNHEVEARRIAQQVMKESGVDIPIFLSCESQPIMRELSRLNAVTLGAYAAEPARKQLISMEKRLQDRGYNSPAPFLFLYRTEQYIAQFLNQGLI